MPQDTQAEHPLSLAWYAQRRPVFTGGNQVLLLRGGHSLFPAQIQAIHQAKHSVWVASYMVTVEGEAASVLHALEDAARRGVAVHMVMDGIGSRLMPEAAKAALLAAGVRLVVYRPVRGLLNVLLNTAQWRRMHVKLCVVDDETAFIGGINHIDDHFDLDHGWLPQPRLDYAVQVSGPAVMPIQHTVRAMWTRATLGRDWRDDLAERVRNPARLKRLRQLWQAARLRLPPEAQRQLTLASGRQQPMQAALVLRDNLGQRRTIERAAHQAIANARTRVDIVTPYFYPGRLLRQALRQAAGRGVQVRLLLQGKPDFRFAALAARVLYEELQRHGVRIFEYQAALLHAKVLCVDDEWATVGSSNLDPLSLMLNLEANLIVRDRGFVRSVLVALEADFKQSREVTPPGHSERSGSSLSRRLTRALVAWCAKTYLRLAGIARYD